MPDLLPLIEAHLRHTGEPVTRFGRRIAGDPRLVGDLRRGRQPKADLAHRIRAACEGGC